MCVCSVWDLDWKGKETGDKDPQLSEVEEKRQSTNTRRENEQGVCLGECRERKGHSLDSQHGQLLHGLDWARAEQTNVEVVYTWQ